MKVELIHIIFGLFGSVLMFVSIYATFVGNHMSKGLCENKFTAALSDMKDWKEGVGYPAWMTDCCYDADRAEEICLAYQDALGEDLECTLLSKENPATLFSCIDSVELCNDDTCVQSCNHDTFCNEGEGTWCEDCY